VPAADVLPERFSVQKPLAITARMKADRETLGVVFLDKVPRIGYGLCCRLIERVIITNQPVNLH
jgi:hypothetical protein